VGVGQGLPIAQALRRLGHPKKGKKLNNQLTFLICDLRFLIARVSAMSLPRNGQVRLSPLKSASWRGPRGGMRSAEPAGLVTGAPTGNFCRVTLCGKRFRIRGNMRTVRRQYAAREMASVRVLPGIAGYCRIRGPREIQKEKLKKRRGAPGRRSAFTRFRRDMPAFQSHASGWFSAACE
jgi:hypothetical protein